MEQSKRHSDFLILQMNVYTTAAVCEKKVNVLAHKRRNAESSLKKSLKSLIVHFALAVMEEDNVKKQFTEANTLLNRHMKSN